MCFPHSTHILLLYINELAKKTHRSVEGRALQEFHPGGRCFGYRSIPIEDATRTDSYGRPQILGVKLEVHPQPAAIVRRIFADYGAGDSIKTIAKKLNAEGVTSPAPHSGRRNPSWAPSAISVMLHNERYPELRCGTCNFDLRRCAAAAGWRSVFASERNGPSWTLLT